MSDSTQNVAVITGASAGIGLAAAKHLAAEGWRIIAVGRNAERGAAAKREILEVSTTDKVDMLIADIALMKETVKLAQHISTLTDRVDLLANNAGGMAKEKVITEEGLEASFAANHLGPFLLTQRLLPLLRNAAKNRPKGSVRIIGTSSDGSEMIATLNLDDMQNLENYSNGLAYCSAKLANVLFVRALAERLKNDGIVAHAFHPGTVASNFFSHTDKSVQERYKDVDMLSPEQGADTLIWLATGEEPGKTSGGYYHQRATREPNPVIYDDVLVERCWKESEKLIERVGV